MLWLCRCLAESGKEIESLIHVVFVHRFYFFFFFNIMYDNMGRTIYFIYFFAVVVFFIFRKKSILMKISSNDVLVLK